MTKEDRVRTGEVRQEFFTLARVGAVRPHLERLARSAAQKGVGKLVASGASSLLDQLDSVRDMDYSPLPGKQVLLNANEFHAMEKLREEGHDS